MRQKLSRPRLSQSGREAIWGYFFISPWILGFLLFSLGPIVWTIYLSFTQYSVLTPPEFIGFDNYFRMFSASDAFWDTLGTTAIYSLVRVPGVIFIAILFAMLINKQSAIMNFFRAALYLPAIIPLVAASILWLWMLNPQYGFVNPALREWFGVIPPNWLRDPNTALYAIILLSFWQVGHTMMIFLAGLQEIPKELYEAADLDGATFVQKTKYVTFPMLTPTIYFNMIIGVINSFQAFAAIFVLTRGGPSGSTMVYVMYLYQQGIEFLEMGYASALALVLVAIVLVLTIVIMKTSDKWVTYDRV